eukprot:239521_1
MSDPTSTTIEPAKLGLQDGTFFIIGIIFVAVTGPICLFLIINHLYRYCKAERNNKRMEKKRNAIVLHKEISILTNIMIISVAVSPVYGLLQRILFGIDAQIGYNASCSSIIAPFESCVYYIGKGSMFILFILRLHSIYSKSVYGYSINKLKICAFVVISVTLFLAIATVITVETEIYHFELNGRKITFCDEFFPGWLVMIVILHEICVTLITLYAFIRPMKLMSKEVENAGTQPLKQLKQFQYAIKITVLTLIALLSSFFALGIVGATNAADIIFVDDCINIFCIILMTPYYKGWYKKICCCFDKCVIKCLGAEFGSQPIEYEEMFDDITVADKTETSTATKLPYKLENVGSSQKDLQS